MNDFFQQFALLDILLTNWDGILVRIGGLDPALEKELAELAQKLGGAGEPEQIALLIDDLLDLVAETPAAGYVRELIARATLPPLEKTRGLIAQNAGEAFAVSSLTTAAASFGQVPSTDLSFRAVPLFFVTNRTEAPEQDLPHRYGGEYARDLSYGRLEVTIPLQRHRLGRIERPRWFSAESPERHIVLQNPESFGSAVFVSKLGAEVQRAPRKELLIFLHGYQVTFEEAARRAAQVATDINFDGAIVLFSWPSAGALRRYAADEDCAAKSAAPLATFLRELEGGPWDRVHLAAHSMGNRVMLSALASHAPFSLPLRNVVLIAADVDQDLFEQQFPQVSSLLQRDRGDLMTSYASNTDRALLISWWLHRSHRVGRFSDAPYTKEGLETIDATAVDTGLLRHSYFGDERSVLTDLGLLLRESLPAARRGLKPGAGSWWEFPK